MVTTRSGTEATPPTESAPSTPTKQSLGKKSSLAKMNQQQGQQVMSNKTNKSREGVDVDAK
jgi:hypothetical protein